IVLIAGNFLREQRWYLVLLLVWAFGSAGAMVAAENLQKDDLIFFMRQQAMYGLVVTVFMASAAIQNERRSRRILAVLSKAVGRKMVCGGADTRTQPVGAEVPISAPMDSAGSGLGCSR